MPQIGGRTRTIGNTNKSRALRDRELREELQTETRTGFDRSQQAHANSLFSRPTRSGPAHPPRDSRIEQEAPRRFSTGIAKSVQFYPHTDEEMDERVKKIDAAFRATYGGLTPDSGLLFALASHPGIPTNGLINAFPFEAGELLGAGTKNYSSGGTTGGGQTFIESFRADAGVPADYEPPQAVGTAPTGEDIPLELTENQEEIAFKVVDAMTYMQQGAYEWFIEPAETAARGLVYRILVDNQLGMHKLREAIPEDVDPASLGLNEGLSEEEATRITGFNPKTDKWKAAEGIADTVGVGLVDDVMKLVWKGGKSLVKTIGKAVQTPAGEATFKAAEALAVINAEEKIRAQGGDVAAAVRENPFQMAVGSLVLIYEGKLKFNDARKVVSQLSDSAIARLGEAVGNEAGGAPFGRLFGEPKISSDIGTRIKARGGELVEEGIENIPTQVTRELTAEANKIIDETPELARRIALGEEVIEDNPQLVNKVFALFRNNADIAGDDTLLEALRRSPLSGEATRAGQTIQALDTGNVHSPTRIINEIVAERTGRTGTRLGRVVQQEIETEADRLVDELGIGLGRGEGPGLGAGLGEGLGEGLGRGAGGISEIDQKVLDDTIEALEGLKGKGGKKVDVDDIVERLKETGTITDEDFLELSRRKLGFSVSREEAGAIRQLTANIQRAEEALRLNPDLPIGSPERIAFGNAEVQLTNLINNLRNPSNEAGFIKDIALKAQKAVRENPNGFSLAIKSIKSIGGLTKAMKASLDNSVLFRQGMKTAVTEPRLWFKNGIKTFNDMIKTFGGKEVMDQVNADIVSRPNALNGLYERGKLAVGIVEEDYPTSVLNKLPIIGRAFKASETAFTAFLQRQRVDIFDKYIDIMKVNGVELTDSEVLNMGTLVNTLTGRGNIGPAEKISEGLNTVFFSPRNFTSNLAVLSGHGLGFTLEKNTFARTKARKQMLTTWSSIAAVLYTADAIRPGSVEWDKTSSDFGKIRIDGTRFDVTGGMGSIATFAARMYRGEEKSSKTGEIYEYGADTFPERNRLLALLKFATNKSSPLTGASISAFLTKEDFLGRPTTPKEQATALFIPMMWEAIEDQNRSQFSSNPYLAIMAESLGISVATYMHPDHPIQELGREYDEDYETFETTDEKFQSRFQWREEFRPELEELTNQPNEEVSIIWTEFLALYDERNQDLFNEQMSPDGDKFPDDIWDNAVQELMDRSDIFKVQYEAIPKKLIER